MSHLHSIYDTDSHFPINAKTREITNQSTAKTALMQGDHNSERFTFEMPRYIEGHDMSLCDRVEIHYINIGGNKIDKSADVYLVGDVQISPEDENVVIFSWLISGNATKYAGILSFLVSFKCLTGDSIDYAWHTGIYSGITIGEGMNNGETVVAEYSDILETWLAGVLDVYEDMVAEIKASADTKIEAMITDALFEEVFSKNILNPSNSENGYYDTNLTETGNSAQLRTIEPIPCEGATYVHIRSNLTDVSAFGGKICCAMFLDANGSYISQESISFSYLASSAYAYTIPKGATKFHFWHNTTQWGVDFSNICLSLEDLSAFEEYGAKIVLKPEGLPEYIGGTLKGKTIVNFGDSIFGKARPPEDISTHLANCTGATVHNCGFGGCRMATHSLPNYAPFSMFALSNAITSGDFSAQEAAVSATSGEVVSSYFADALALLKSIDFSKVDIITIAYGTNDFAAEIALDNESNLYDTSKYGGALRYSIETILSAFPNIRIFLCSQIYRFWMADGVFSEDSDSRTYGGQKLTDFVAKTKEIANEYHLPFIDNYYELGLNKFNRTVYFPATDGTHPNNTGRELIAKHIAHKLF